MKDKTTIKSLEMLACSESGLDVVLQEDLSEQNYARFYQVLLQGRYQDLHAELEANPQLVDSARTKAIFLLNLILLGKELKQMHISLRAPQEYIIDAYTYELIELYKTLCQEIKIAAVDFYQYRNLLPSVVIYYSDYLLKDLYWEKRNDSAAQKQILERVWAHISDTSSHWKFMNEDLNAQCYRLQAIYYRRLGDHKKAEESLIKYREKFKPDPKAKVKINKIDLSQKYPADKTLNNMDKIYQEVSAIQKEVLARSGVHEDTCFYYGCTDCCKKDFPTVSLVEFLHIKSWLAKNNIDIKPFVERAQAIQKKHRELFGEPLRVVDQTQSVKQAENPYGLQFTCPFLSDDDICQVHGARPLACRSFGLATIDGASVQACKYYLTQYQYNSSTRNERDVFDSEPATHMLGEANSELAAKHGYKDMQQPVGTLVAWLSSETIKN